MGIHPMQNPRHCPRCGRDLSAGPRPERVKVPGFPAEATYGLDPVCEGRWQIWDKTSALRAKAQPHVDATNGFFTAAEAHGLPDADECLAAAGGDPEAAWQAWADEYCEDGWA
ncbi:hypothetical protein ACGFWD_44070 [Streptomyces sp. NPDC048448]|uniref:hypothetical protein n=1 Tax=Streptomyces sp. NPDC048448 TaxID=3365554 RepID=UPI0037165B24